MADKELDVIVREVDSSEGAVAEVRKEVTPTAVGESVPIDRLPLRPNFVMLANSGITSANFGSTDRCIRIITVPARNGGAVQCHCSKACVSVGTQKLCPEHDAAAFQPSQTPVAKGRVTNSASIKLSTKELADCGLTEEPAQFAAAPLPVAASHVKAMPVFASGGDISISFTLDELASGDVVKAFAKRACEALDRLSCPDLGSMKRMVAIQARLAKIERKAAKTKRGIVSNDAE